MKNETTRQTQGAESERAVCDEPLAAAQGKAGDPGRIRVRIVSRRTRLLDPDNLSGGVKYFVDCLRYAGLIPDDRAQDIILETTQEKVGKDQEETIIEITKP